MRRGKEPLRLGLLVRVPQLPQLVVHAALRAALLALLLLPHLHLNKHAERVSDQNALKYAKDYLQQC